MNNSINPIITILSYILGALLWFWLWWHVISKMGYRGVVRKIWIAGMCIPPIAPPTLMLLLLSPWPVCKQLRQSKTMPKNKTLDVDGELEQLRRQMRG